MRKNSQFATAADTFDTEALIAELETHGGISNVVEGRFRRGDPIRREGVRLNIRQRAA